MIDYIHEVENIAEQYGLQMTSLDATNVTLMVRMEIMPSIFIQIYRNAKKNKLSMALVSGNNRIYGVDSEGGVPHEHPIQQPGLYVITRETGAMKQVNNISEYRQNSKSWITSET